MLQIKNLTIRHRQDYRVLLEDFSFVLNPGDRAAVIGEEGNGKSTLLRLIHDPALVETYVEYTGEILKNGGRTGYLAQELSAGDQDRTILEYCGECPQFYEWTPREISELAGQLGLNPELLYSDQRMGSLSGGEKVKVRFARMMLERPDILLLDEPNNDLDLETLEWMEAFLTGCGLPLFCISHDELFLERMSNVVIHLEQLRRKTKAVWTVSRTGYAEYADGRARGLARQEQAARREQREWREQQERFRRIQQKVESRQNSISRQDPHGGRLLKKKMHAVKSLERRYEREQKERTEMPDPEEAIFLKLEGGRRIASGKQILDLRGERLEAGGRILAEDITLRVTAGEKVCIIGKNGVGKTTLLRKIADSLLARSDLKAAYMPQDYGELLDMEMTPPEFLSRSGSREEQSRIRTYLGSMKYTADEMSHPIGRLSGGQKAKLLLLKISLDGSDVLVLDEPTRNFSPLSGPVIRELLKRYSGTIISVSHDRKYIEEVCDRICRLTPDGLEELRGFAGEI